MNALLVELHTEELPPKALKSLSEAFAAGITRGLSTRSFLAPHSVTTAFGAPRRLAVQITDVRSLSADQPYRQKLIPAAIGLDALGKATAALTKKLAALGLNVDVGGLMREHDGKQDVLIYEGTKPGIELVDALQATLDETLAALPIPKVMNYQLADGTTTVQFVRPAHGLVALHGHTVVPVTTLGLVAGTKTCGHRFMSDGKLPLHAATTYVEQLERQGMVMPSFAARRAKIVDLLQQAAARLEAVVVMPDALLDEVTALVEWPVVYESGFEKEFLEVPQECLILTMQANQKYFALKDAQGRLLNRFLLVSHLQASDGGAAISKGNARVVRARLADAKFFYDQDRKRTLESRLPLLANVIYHAKLGSQLERLERLVGIAVVIARQLGVDVTHVERAARLAKADLRTEMVGEFPELQGVMGTYYARHDGEPADVADAIEEHYRPRFAGDGLPESAVGICVALADRIEALVGLFGIGEKPSGDRDPFALRRLALAVLRLLIERRLPLSLIEMVDAASGTFAAVPAFKPATPELIAFIYERLRGLLREQGYSTNEVEAVVSLAPARLDDITARLAAVRAFMRLPEAASLAAANKRIGNILKKSDSATAQLDPALLVEPAEQALAEAYHSTAPVSERLMARGDYTESLCALAPLKLPVDRFFDDVMVNVDDARLRANRLALLAALRAQMNRVADLSMLAAG